MSALMSASLLKTARSPLKNSTQLFSIGWTRFTFPLEKKLALLTRMVLYCDNPTQFPPLSTSSTPSERILEIFSYPRTKPPISQGTAAHLVLCSSWFSGLKIIQLLPINIAAQLHIPHWSSLYLLVFPSPPVGSGIFTESVFSTTHISQKALTFEMCFSSLGELFCRLTAPLFFAQLLIWRCKFESSLTSAQNLSP